MPSLPAGRALDALAFLSATAMTVTGFGALVLGHLGPVVGLLAVAWGILGLRLSLRALQAP